MYTLFGVQQHHHQDYGNYCAYTAVRTSDPRQDRGELPLATRTTTAPGIISCLPRIPVPYIKKKKHRAFFASPGAGVPQRILRLRKIRVLLYSSTWYEVVFQCCCTAVVLLYPQPACGLQCILCFSHYLCTFITNAVHMIICTSSE